MIDEGGSLAIAESSIRNSAGEEVDAAGMNFTNIYNDGQISYQISGTKSLSTPESADTGTGSSDGEEQNARSGAQLAEGDYTFVLYENGVEIDRTQNTAAAAVLMLRKRHR